MNKIKKRLPYTGKKKQGAGQLDLFGKTIIKHLGKNERALDYSGCRVTRAIQKSGVNVYPLDNEANDHMYNVVFAQVHLAANDEELRDWLEHMQDLCFYNGYIILQIPNRNRGELFSGDARDSGYILANAMFAEFVEIKGQSSSPVLVFVK